MLVARVRTLGRTMSSKSDVPGAAAAAPEPLAWGESPALYVSYGMVADKGVRPALTSAVAAAPSFTVLSPPMGLDYFAVFDAGDHLGAAAAVERLRVRLAAAIAEQIDGELSSDAPRFGGAQAPAHDVVVVGWWKTVIQEAFRAVYEEAARDGEDVGATAFVVALVLEKYTVIASSGDSSKAVLCRGGEHVELTPTPDARRANTAEDEKENAAGQAVAPPTSKLANFVQITLPSGAGSSSVVNEPPPAVVIPELDVVAVERNAQDDEFLILANRGLWGAVPPASACAFVRRSLAMTSRITMPLPWEAPVDASASPAAVLARDLADKAVYAGSQDNVSVAIVLFKDDDFWANK